jgi:23S rRNA (guanosine2251-2'-O)-methyltransferase
MREILYGRQPVRETLRAKRRQVYKLLLAEGIRPAGIVGQIVALAEQAGIPVQTVNRGELDKLGGEVNHQGLAAEVSGYPYVAVADLVEAARRSGAPPFLLLLDHIQDPQNLGSLLRTAEAAGIHGVVIPGRRAAGVTPAAVRASAGAAEHTRVAQVTNMVRAMEDLKAGGVWMAGLEAAPGAERETCDFLIRVPMLGQVESLNAAVAGAIALYEARRQRG